MGLPQLIYLGIVKNGFNYFFNTFFGEVCFIGMKSTHVSETFPNKNVKI